MKNYSLFLVVILFTLAIIACSGQSPVPTEPPTATPTVEPTLEGPTLSDTMTRETDGMVMVYVPGGTFQMGSSESEVDDANEAGTT